MYNSDLSSIFSEYTFADVGNLDHCTKYLNQTLVTFGFPASLDLFATDPVQYFYFLVVIILCIFVMFNLIIIVLILVRFQLHELATVYTHCCSRDSVTLNLESLLMNRDNGTDILCLFTYVQGFWSIIWFSY